MAKLLELARAERAELTDLLATLAPGQWDEPTLCEGWSVRHVVAHVFSYEDLTFAGTIARLVRAGFRLSKANDIGVAEHLSKSPEELVRFAADHLQPRGLPAIRGGLPAFLDALIHHQDIRRALQLPRDVPAERLAPALRLCVSAPPLPAKRNARGLSVRATDLDFGFGDGPLVEGPAEALLMALAGRHGVVAELRGAGQAELAARVGG